MQSGNLPTTPQTGGASSGRRMLEEIAAETHTAERRRAACDRLAVLPLEAQNDVLGVIERLFVAFHSIDAHPAELRAYVRPCAIRLGQYDRMTGRQEWVCETHWRSVYTADRWEDPEGCELAGQPPVYLA